jgi:hypothetical protein
MILTPVAGQSDSISCLRTLLETGIARLWQNRA